MKISEIPSLLDAQTVQSRYTDGDIKTVFTSDLLSDVLGNAPDNCVLVTIQAHRNAVAVATTKDSPAIIVCSDRPVPPDMIEAAADENIGIFVTSLNQYMVSGRLYAVVGA